MFKNLIVMFVVAGSAFAQSPAVSSSYVTGSVTAIAGSTITLGSISVDIRNARVINATDRTTATLKVGDHVTVVLSPSRAAETVTVDAIAVVRGTVDSVDSTKITMLGNTFAVSPRTVYGGYTGAHQLRSIDDVHTGNLVAIDTSESGALLRVWGLGAPPAPPKARPVNAAYTFQGTVAKIEPNRYTVGTTVVISSSQTKIDGNIVVGTLVSVVGLRVPDGSVLATRIFKP